MNDPDDEKLRRKEEFRTWFFLTVVMAPVLAATIVVAYGFAVWAYQMVMGPPGYGERAPRVK